MLRGKHLFANIFMHSKKLYHFGSEARGSPILSGKEIGGSVKRVIGSDIKAHFQGQEEIKSPASPPADFHC